jgi:hypothetical protein
MCDKPLHVAGAILIPKEAQGTNISHDEVSIELRMGGTLS